MTQAQSIAIQDTVAGASAVDVLSPLLSRTSTAVQTEVDATSQDLATAQAAANAAKAKSDALAALGAVDQSVLQGLLADGVAQQLADAADAVAKAGTDRDTAVAAANAARDAAVADSKSLTAANADLNVQLEKQAVTLATNATALDNLRGNLDTATIVAAAANAALAKVHADAIAVLTPRFPGTGITDALGVIAWLLKRADGFESTLKTHDDVFAQLQADKTALIAVLNQASKTFTDAATQAAKLSTGA